MKQSSADETAFVISTSSCGDASTRFVTARAIADVKRAILVSRWKPNHSYFYEQLGLHKRDAVFAVLVGVLSGKSSFHKLTKEDIGSLSALRDLNDITLLAVLPDDIIEKLFSYAFTGGDGEQRGSPGKEWITISVQPLTQIYPSIHREFSSSMYITDAGRQKYLEEAGLSSANTK